MSKEYFTDNLSIEDIAELTDKMIKFERSAKTRKFPAANIIKIVSVAAALVLFIGFLNFLPMLINFDDNNIAPADLNETTKPEEIYAPEIDQSDLFLPTAIEKSFFEEKILNAVTNKSALNKILSYYNFKNTLYVLDPNISVWEEDIILDYLREYTDLTRDDMLQMCADNNITLPKYIESEYSNIKYGRAKDTLLLDIEWHNYDTYMAEVAEPRKNDFIDEEYKTYDWYINSSDEEKEEFDKKRIERIERAINDFENQAIEIKEQKWYYSRTINGKSTQDIYNKSPFTSDADISIWRNDNPVDISQYLDENGYYIFEIYPRWAYVLYYDENGEWHQKHFENRDNCNQYIKIKTQDEYEKILENKIIPFCDDLLERGLLTQEEYDYYTISDWLEYYIDLYFN